MTEAVERTSLEVKDGLAVLRLVRVAGRNGIDMAMVESLAGQVDEVAANPEVRALLIGADGPAFTVGGDLRHLRGELERLPAELETMISGYHRTLAQLAELPIPVLVAAHGPVAGGGLGLLWCADLVLAAENLRIATGFVHLALSGDGGSSWHLPRLVGLRRAQELILGGRVLDAQEALDWGLVTRVLPAAELEAEALAQARAWATGPTYAFGRMKRLLLESSVHSYPEQLAAERRAIVACAATGDAREGIAAFTERRPPNFRGR
ncbi:MAG TPA: enoyl-CoA hydratase-related protein [Pseudonocardia sp.]|jgi:2-(1,2-epoxy-1,2-dihydrophenyl)acetyl-CoA isomerase